MTGSRARDRAFFLWSACVFFVACVRVYLCFFCGVRACFCGVRACVFICFFVESKGTKVGGGQLKKGSTQTQNL